ncbi:MAG: histidine kinase [Bacteroidales bacterium]|nr:histidine kinase [Bacteroidales bacterium]
MLQTANCKLWIPDSFPSPGFRSLLILALLADLNLSAQNPFIQQITTNNGLPSNEVFYIFQDSKKFIWFGTRGGVAKYDGTTFNNYKMKDGLSHVSVNWIKEDAFGRIWFRSPAGKIDFFYQNKIFNEKNTIFLDSLKPVPYNFFQDEDRTMYFYSPAIDIKIMALDTGHRIIRYRPNTEGFRTSTGKNMRIWQIKKVATGEFLLWTNRGILKIRSLADTSVLSCKYDKYTFDNLFFSDDQTAFYTSDNNKTGSVKIYEFRNEFLIDSLEVSLNSITSISSVIEDDNGMLWVATIDKGVFCIMNKKIIYHFEIKRARSIIQDHEHNIWIGSNDGVFKISPFFFLGKHYDKSLFKSQGINKLSSNPGNGVWCANKETVYLLKNNEFYLLDYQSNGGFFSNILGLKNNCMIIGQLLFTTCDFHALSGLSIDPVTKKVNYENEYSASATISSIISNKDESEFFTCSGSNVLTILSPEKKFKIINRLNIRDGTATIFYNAHNQIIVNAVTKNYIILKKRKVPCNELSPIFGKVICNHAIISDIADLYCTEDDSIYLVKNKKMINLSHSFDYPVEVERRRIVYHDSSLYMPTLANIYICDDPLNIFRNEPVRLKILDVNFNNINDLLINNDSLYIASEDGLTVLPEEMTRKIKTQVPIPYFKSVQVNDNEADLSGLEIVLTGTNKIKFSFGAINYSSTPVIFSYKLQGFDSTWTTGSTHEIVYSNLPRGNYVFLVLAEKPASPHCDPIEYRITIKATFWQHPLFFLFLSLLFIGLIPLVIIRRKNIQIKRRELDHQLITLEQKALQSMMNPHFIFNSLGSIQSYLLQKKSGEAGLYLTQFARLIRQNLNAINSASINLDEEIDRLTNYLDLEKMRMENRFDYSIEVAENVNAEELQIPSMIIQPFVENAIWHGISSLKDRGEIVIRFHRHDDRSLEVIVEDNGIGMKRSNMFSEKREKHLHLGMEMTRKRLDILGRKFSVKTCLIFSEMFPGNPNPGTRVEMVVPVGI